MLTFGSIHQLEVYAHGLLLVGRPQAESVVAQVLVRLDVVLVLVGPMERDLLALVGDGVDAWLVDALGEKVTLGVVAAEETEQVIVDLAFQRIDVHRVCRQPDAQVFDLLRRLRIDAKPLRLLNGLVQILFDFRLVGAPVERKGVLHLRQQVLIEELRHLGALGMHHAVETEVQVGLIELKQLHQ